MSLKKSHKSYPQVFKDEAVLMVLEQGYSVADAAKSLGVSTSLLYNWKEKYQALQQGITLEESERDELKRLRREVLLLKGFLNFSYMYYIIVLQVKK
jgi:transposase-like protein